MAEESPSTLFNILQSNEETGDEEFVGRASFTRDGVLKLTAAKESLARKIALAIQQANQKEQFYLEVPAPAGSPQFATASRTVERGDEDYLLALQDYLKKYHRLTLEATAGEEPDGPEA